VLKGELAKGLDSVEALRTALQRAIELEHATIPAYLYALYSLGSGNTEIAALVSSVVIEEMSHFLLAANVLNAIGGAPVIDRPGFIPKYPGPLPGAVGGGLVVPLEPFSLELVENVFMAIEEPEKPPTATSAAGKGQPLTIGAFYDAIKQAIEKAGQSIFTGRKEYQVTQAFFDSPHVKIVEVTDVASANTAIDLILEQGEGTSHSPLDDLVPGGELAHYYRYAEIVKGKRLEHTPDADPLWGHVGPPIPFEPAKVLPMVANPTSAGYATGSAARYGCDTFNYTYTSLLKVLHDTFNGNPSSLPAAVGLMESLKEQTKTLVTIDSGLGGTDTKTGKPIFLGAGPSFEYRPTNP